MFTADDLRQFSGTENYYRHPLARGVLYTDGVQFMAANGAGWLLDAIVSHLPYMPRRDFNFHLWKLTCHGCGGATLSAHRDSDEPAVITQHIEYTDFPLSEFKMYACKDCDDWVLMLPSEY